LGGKPTLECGHLPLKFYTGDSHQAFNPVSALRLTQQSIVRIRVC
jgi:hypothetical protein